MTFVAYIGQYHALLTELFGDQSPRVPGTILRTSDLSTDGPTARLAALEEAHPDHAAQLSTPLGHAAWVALCSAKGGLDWREDSWTTIRCAKGGS